MSLSERWRVPAWRALARGWLWAGQPARALGCLDALLHAVPGDLAARSLRAYLRAQAGALAAARADYDHLLAARPDDGAGWFNLGFVLQRAGDDAGALAAFRRAVDCDASLDRAWYGAGLVLVRAGRWDEAAAAFEQATTLQPMAPHGWVQLARVQQRRRPEEVRRIIDHLRGFEPAVARRLADELALPAVQGAARLAMPGAEQGT